MKTMLWAKNVPLEKFNEQMMAYVAECRRLVGYQSDADWECPFNTCTDKKAFCDQFGDKAKDIGMLTCYPCHVKEAHDWMAKGLPIPISVAAK